MKDYTLEEFQEAFPGMFDNVYCGFYLPRGWGEIVYKACKSIALTGAPVAVSQVKEKFGGLRFYYDLRADCSEERADAAARVADIVEACSYWVCQDCGTTQNVTTEGDYITTRCAGCRGTERSA